MINSDSQIDCQVCQDVAVGFHCGAYVCEACKKFFIRCLKLNCGEKFRCSFDGYCSVSKATRTKCPCCRYKKCLALKMYGPGSQNVSKEINHMPCQVCGAPSSGFHFGAITCEGCKGFFRRCLWDRNMGSYKCNETGNLEGRCEITWRTRNVCKFCRYKKCLSVGMESHKSRIGRQSNLIKHRTHVVLNEIKLAKGLPVDSTFPVSRAGKTSILSSPETEQIPCQNKELFLNGISASQNDSCESDKIFPRNISHNKEENFQLAPDDDVVDFPELLSSSHSLIPYSGFGSTSVKSLNICKSFPPLSEVKISGSNLEALYFSKSTSFISSSSSSLSFSSSLVSPKENSSRHLEKCSFDRISCDTPEDGWNLHHRYHDYCPKSFQMRNMTSISEQPALLPLTSEHSQRVTSFSRHFQSKMTQQSTPVECINQTNLTLVDLSLTHEMVINLMSELYNYLEPVFTRFDLCELNANSSMEIIWEVQMEHLVRCAKLVLSFAKKVPGFRSFSLDEKIVIFQKCIFPITSFLLALGFDEKSGKINWFGFSENEQHIVLEKFEAFKYFLPHFYELGEYVSRLSLDRVEVSFICALYLMDVGNRHDYKEFFLDVLESYIKKKFGPESQRHFYVFRCLTELSQLFQIHSFVFNIFINNPKYAGLTLPQLFTEAVVIKEQSPDSL